MKNDMQVVSIQPGHHLFNSYKAGSGEYVFAIEATEKEHKPGIIHESDIADEQTFPVFGIVIHSAQMAELMAQHLMNLSERIKMDINKPIVAKTNNDIITVHEYNVMRGGK